MLCYYYHTTSTLTKVKGRLCWEVDWIAIYFSPIHICVGPVHEISITPTIIIIDSRLFVSSQIHTLQQLQNIASYGFLKRRLENYDLHIHALWFDIYTGDIFYFSRQSKKFVEINEFTLDILTKEVKEYYS